MRSCIGKPCWLCSGVVSEAFEHLQKLPLSYVDAHSSGDLISRIVTDIDQFTDGLLLGFTWQFIFISIFEAFSKKTGIAAFSGWLSNPETGFIGLLILTVWQMSGYMMIVYIAQIQQIPESVKEAARIDGANSWQLMRYIILPLMMPAFTIGLFLSISSSFKMFDQNLALTQGGPYKSTEMIALNIYNSAFGANEFGFAQAKAIVFLIIVAGIGVTQLVITKRKEVEM